MFKAGRKKSKSDALSRFGALWMPPALRAIIIPSLLNGKQAASADLTKLTDPLKVVHIFALMMSTLRRPWRGEDFGKSFELE